MFRGVRCIRPRRGWTAGFTLVELLVVIVVGAVLVGLAVPALQHMIASNQLAGMTDSFATALNEARSEAGKYGVRVAFTTGAGANWGSGWTMFVDTNGDGVQETGQTPPEVTLRTGAAMPSSSYTMTAIGASASTFSGLFWFDATGRLLNNAGATPGAPAEFQFCQNGGPPGGAARLVTVAGSGRVRVAQNNASGQPIDDSGNPVTTCP